LNEVIDKYTIPEKSLYCKYCVTSKIVISALIICSFTTIGFWNGDYVFADLNETPSPPETLSYENSTFGVYAEYPSDWESLTPSYNNGDRTLQIVEFWSPDGTGVVTIARDIFDTAETLQTYLAESTQSYRSSFSNFTLLFADPFQSTLADNPAYRLVYTFNDDETGLPYMTSETGTIIPGTDIAYFIKYSSPLVYYANNEQIAENILESMQIHVQLPGTEINGPPDSETEQGTGTAGEI
jgi:hypothetical protein